MNTELITYLIIGVVVIYFIIAKVLPFFRKVSKVSKGLFSKIYLNKNSDLSTEQYKKISLGAIYSEQQTAFINSLTTGTGKADLKTILEKWWGIGSREDAMETLSYLEEKGFRFYLPTVLKAYKAPKPEQEAVILSQLSDEEDIEKAFSQLRNLQDTIEELRSNNIITHDSDIEKIGTNGWDFGRLVFLTRLCYDAQYITEQEAWQFIDSAYSLAKASFKSWDTYARSYVVGRSLWGGEDAANVGIMSIAEYLQKEPRSPWVQIPW